MSCKHMQARLTYNGVRPSESVACTEAPQRIRAYKIQQTTQSNSMDKAYMHTFNSAQSSKANLSTAAAAAARERPCCDETWIQVHAHLCNEPSSRFASNMKSSTSICVCSFKQRRSGSCRADKSLHNISGAYRRRLERIHRNKLK
jgi:hypothetical protein